MWDSLESVWEAASCDEECECQVVPIPYYTKDENGEFSELHYEGADFEETCPIINYKEYSLEKEQPDVMYIHNPYDQYNTVTMVEPSFFSEKLKAYGGILVYVPYYISGGCSSYENLNIAYGKGAVKSDYIILQSEAHKEAYKYWGFPERRLLVLGSPKIDAIYKHAKKEIKISDEWQEAIQEKKVILLNTSIISFLNSEDWLHSVECIVKKILERKELALIWRPHPLLLDTCKALGKDKEEQYHSLAKRINEAVNGLIDENSDAAKAINVSRAMISDHSSLVLQYTFTGKPTMLLRGSSKQRDKYVFCDFYSNYFYEDGMDIGNSWI